MSNGVVLVSDYWDDRRWKPKLLTMGTPHYVALLHVCGRLFDIGRERLYRAIQFYTHHEDPQHGFTSRSLWLHNIGSANISFLTHIRLFLTISGEEWMSQYASGNAAGTKIPCRTSRADKA
jgi:hypothetical protein